MPYISQSDAALLTAARQVLSDLSAAATRDMPTGTDGYDGFRRGRFAEACEEGESGIFRVFNVASAYLHDKTAEQAIAGYNAARMEGNA